MVPEYSSHGTSQCHFLVHIYRCRKKQTTCNTHPNMLTKTGESGQTQTILKYSSGVYLIPSIGRLPSQGCGEDMASSGLLPQIVLGPVLAGVGDAHPRVRHAALGCLGQMAEDYGDWDGGSGGGDDEEEEEEGGSGSFQGTFHAQVRMREIGDGRWHVNIGSRGRVCRFSPS